MRSAVDLRHRRVWMVGQDVRVLRPLKFVKKLRPQHDIEIFPDAGNHLVHSKLPEQRRKNKQQTKTMSELHSRICVSVGYVITDSSESVEKKTISIFTCCQSFLLISCNLHNLQGQHQRSFWQVGGRAVVINMRQC